MLIPESSDGGRGCGTAFGRPRDFLANRFVYLVVSQRARGLSIGINMNPDKHCNFDCVYCEVNRAEVAPDSGIDLPTMAAELEALLHKVQANQIRELPGFSHLPEELLELKEVALSGDGEPTLSAQFKEIVGEVVELRRHEAVPFFKIVLITNTTGLPLQDVRKGLRLLTSGDEIWVKLEAGTQKYMDKVNVPDITLRKVMANILSVARERPVVVQSLFPLISGEEPSEQEIEKYVHRLQELKAAGAQIAAVQVYSAHRPPHLPNCSHLPLASLSRIARRIRTATGLKAEVF
ncbi:Radical SAM domain protein [Verrucomicrobia bacterium]|nr:Radical SAM domain protein [Verrucomicrobiota bacterium]